MAGGSGFQVDPSALYTESQNFAQVIPPLALNVEQVMAAAGVDTGDPALDALIRRLATQIADSHAGAGKAIQADADGLAQNAATYLSADQTGAPGSSGPAPGRGPR